MHCYKLPNKRAKLSLWNSIILRFLTILWNVGYAHACSAKCPWNMIKIYLHQTKFPSSCPIFLMYFFILFLPNGSISPDYGSQVSKLFTWSKMYITDVSLIILLFGFVFHSIPLQGTQSNRRDGESRWWIGHDRLGDEESALAWHGALCDTGEE